MWIKMNIKVIFEKQWESFCPDPVPEDLSKG